MGTWIIIVITYILIPALMTSAGWMIWKHPPKTINAIYGYHTRMSSLNQNTWRFSQEYAGRLWVRWGIRMMPVSILLLMFIAAFGEKAAATAGSVLCMIQIVIMLSSIAVVERMLNKIFDKHGNLKK